MSNKNTLVFLFICALLDGCAQQPVSILSDTTTSQKQMIQQLKEINQQLIAHPQDISLRTEQLDITRKLVDGSMRNAGLAIKQNNYEQASQQWHDVLV